MGAPFGSCTNSHASDPDDHRSREGRRAYKELLVNRGQAHAALVFDGDLAVGWCQYGSPDELPGIHHRKDYEAGLVALPHYRQNCILVDKVYPQVAPVDKMAVGAGVAQGATL